MTIGINLTPTLKEVVCAFQGPDLTPKMCKISIANGVSCRDSVKGSKNNTVVSGVTVFINLNGLISDADEGRRFCYNLTARAGTEEVVLQNTVFVDIIATGSNGPQVAAAVVVPIVIVPFIILVIVTVTLVILVSFLNKREESSYNIHATCTKAYYLYRFI